MIEVIPGFHCGDLTILPIAAGVKRMGCELRGRRGEWKTGRVAEWASGRVGEKQIGARELRCQIKLIMPARTLSSSTVFSPLRPLSPSSYSSSGSAQVGPQRRGD